MEQRESLKHFCRICKKGFGCGRALGGHMRAHGIGDDVDHVDDDDAVGDWEDKIGGNSSAGNKSMYAHRVNANRIKSGRICKNCGKEFMSWKSFIEHGRSISLDDAERSRWSDDDDDGGMDGKGCVGWSKGKRSKRVVMVENLKSNCLSTEEEGEEEEEEEEEEEKEELANCLVMLSTARFDPLVVVTADSCASASKEEERHRNYAMAAADANRVPGEKAKGVARGVFECKACKKVFNSHQALGGHRASHKKVKGCFAAKLDELDESTVEEDVITVEDDVIASPAVKRKQQKAHECSICHRVFASGQALGGHKRSHWVTSNSPYTAMAKLHQLQEHSQQLQQSPNLDKCEPIDLNLPAPLEDGTEARQYNVGSSSLEFPTATALYLQHCIGIHSNNNNNDNPSPMLDVGHEDDKKINLAKLSDIKDMKFSGASTPWLQIGIGSGANESSEQ